MSTEVFVRAAAVRNFRGGFVRRGWVSTQRDRATARVVPLAQVLLWLGGHALLGAAWQLSPLVGLMHGLITLGAVLAVAAGGSHAAVAGAVVYVSGFEILWRLSKAPLPHLLGMYLVILLCAVAALRRRRAPPVVAWLYLLPLLPSIWLTLTAVSDVERARQLVAFNLAGPVALFAVVWFGHTARGSTNVWRVATVGGGAVAATSAAILMGIARAESIRFTTESNFAMSAGYGPNQVASVLSFGLLLLAGYVWLRARQRAKSVVWLLIVGLAVQTLLTFSRAGVAMVLGALAGMGVLLLKRRELRLVVIASAVSLWALSNWVLVPVLDDVTGGAFIARYTSADPSNRDVIAKSDLQIFRENPLLGVGPGIGTERRGVLLGKNIAAHTEFTRVLAEHGVFGVVSLLALIALSVRSVRGGDNTPRRAWVLGMFIWAWLYFAVNAFRTALPAATIMLALLVLAGQARRQPRPELALGAQTATVGERAARRGRWLGEGGARQW